MAKKYKNTVHKNPFRENRPKGRIPWRLIGITAAFLALVITVTLVIRSVSGPRKLTAVENGGLYDKRSGITYSLAPFAYKPHYYDSGKAAMTFNGFNLYQLKYMDENGKYVKVSTEKMLLYAEDGVYQIYYNSEQPLPALSEMNARVVGISENGLLIRPIDFAGEEEARAVVAALENESARCEKGEGPKKTDEDSTKILCLANPEDYPEFAYCIYYLKDTDGVRYLYDDNLGIYVRIGDLLSDLLS